MHASQPLLPSISASNENQTSNNTYVDKAYTKLKAKFQRNVFTRPAEVLGNSPDFPFLAILAIYELPESGLHWSHSYFQCHKDKLRICTCLRLSTTAAACIRTNASRIRRDLPVFRSVFCVFR